MADTVAPEFARFVDELRRDKQLPIERAQLKDGEVSKPVFIDNGRASEFVRVAAKRAAGFFRPTKRTEVVWVRGDSELAINLVKIEVKATDGFVHVNIPIRCDQSGSANVDVVFAVGSAKEPAGLYASTYRRPNGPLLVVETWGDALIAFAWECMLGMITGIAGATGKDHRGNVHIPVEITATDKGLEIVPMARHRFSGSSTLLTKTSKGVIR